MKTIVYYKSLKTLEEKRPEYYIRKLKSLRIFRVVLNNVYHSEESNEISTRLFDLQHKISNIGNADKQKSHYHSSLGTYNRQKTKITSLKSKRS